jgi:thioredoxin-like negative regulator of GroEL
MYMGAYLILAILFPQPLYKGETRATEYNPETLEEIVLNESGGDREVTHIIELFAPWSPQCLVLEPVFAELSRTYSTSKLQFGKIDVSRWPSVAKRFNVNLNGVTEQLPTLIKIKEGKEVSRIPVVSEDGKKVYGGKFRRADIVAVFDLDSTI